jgi:hypothetical protein
VHAQVPANGSAIVQVVDAGLGHETLDVRAQLLGLALRRADAAVADERAGEIHEEGLAMGAVASELAS